MTVAGGSLASTFPQRPNSTRRGRADDDCERDETLPQRGSDSAIQSSHPFAFVSSRRHVSPRRRSLDYAVMYSLASCIFRSFSACDYDVLLTIERGLSLAAVHEMVPLPHSSRGCFDGASVHRARNMHMRSRDDESR